MNVCKSLIKCSSTAIMPWWGLVYCLFPWGEWSNKHGGASYWTLCYYIEDYEGERTLTIAISFKSKGFLCLQVPVFWRRSISDGSFSSEKPATSSSCLQSVSFGRVSTPWLRRLRNRSTSWNPETPVVCLEKGWEQRGEDPYHCTWKLF